MSFRLFDPASGHRGWPTSLHAAERLEPAVEQAIGRRSRRPVGRFLPIAASAASLLLATPSFAKDYATRDVGEWTVSASSDRQGCFLTRSFDGPRETTLLLGLDVDGSNRLTILNPNWSIRAKEQIKLTYRLSNASFPRHLAVGIAADGKKGFVTSFGAAFPSTFAASRFLHITRGSVPVEELSLEGSGAAVAELRKCVDVYRGAPAPAAPSKAGKSRIPLDPFASDTSRKSRK